jgi:phosphohistidine phosphatase
MDLLLIRHGHAIDEAPNLGDTGRWLSEKGRKATRRVARWLAKGGRRRPAVIWSSPLVRAMQSAEILAAELGYEGEVRAVGELSPGRDPGDLVALLSASTLAGPLALVGHEPSLSVLANALASDAGIDAIKKSGVAAIAWENGGGRLRFILDPADMKKHKRPPPPAPPPPAEPPAEGA